MTTHLDATTEMFLSFQLKGGLYPLTALQILEPNLPVFEVQLSAKLEQAPKFFLHAPIVIDLQKLKPGAKIDLKQLKDILLKKNLVPVGIKGATPEQQATAIDAGFAIFQESTRAETTQVANNLTVKTEDSSEPEAQGNLTKIITEPVRSGQQIYARGGDLIVVGPVSHGAELLADGNIHIYGSLRGRALAGVTGDQTAHIFCQSLEAELISIAGQYKISEDIDQTIWRLAVDISMVSGRLHIQPF